MILETRPNYMLFSAMIGRFQIKNEIEKGGLFIYLLIYKELTNN